MLEKLAKIWRAFKDSTSPHIRISLLLVICGTGIISPGFKDVLVNVSRIKNGLQPLPDQPAVLGLSLIVFGLVTYGIGAWASKRESSQQLALKINYRNGSKSVFRLSAQKSVSVGRGTENDLVISDEYASRNHCIINVREDHLHVRDLAPTNPTRVNGVVNSAGMVVGMNDRMTIGRTEVVVVRG